MASGASRRKAKRASVAAHAEADRLNNLRRMAEQDPVREGEAFPMGRAKTRRHFAKRGTDAISMYSRMGNDSMYGRVNKMPRGKHLDVNPFPNPHGFHEGMGKIVEG
jgi:hypothetical protein